MLFFKATSESSAKESFGTAFVMPSFQKFRERCKNFPM